MMTVYVAGASAELDLVSGYMAKLLEAGVTVTFDWPANIRAVGNANPREASVGSRMQWSEEDLRGVYDAHTFWLLVPAGPTIGAWVEYGYAWALRRRIVVSGDHLKTIFTSLADHAFQTHDEALAFIIRRSKQT